MRAQVVLLDVDRVLMAAHAHGARCYWVLPGGGIEPGETPAEAAVREVAEETGLAIVIRRLLFVDGPRAGESVRITSPRYTFLGEIVGGALEQVEDPSIGNSANGRLVGAAWMPFHSQEFDASTRETLELVERSLGGRVPSHGTGIE